MSTLHRRCKDIKSMLIRASLLALASCSISLEFILGETNIITNIEEPIYGYYIKYQFISKAFLQAMSNRMIN